MANNGKAKHRDKIQRALEKRINGYNNADVQAKRGMTKPGSQNRNKTGYFTR